MEKTEYAELYEQVTQYGLTDEKFYTPCTHEDYVMCRIEVTNPKRSAGKVTLVGLGS